MASNIKIIAKLEQLRKELLADGVIDAAEVTKALLREIKAQARSFHSGLEVLI